MQRQLHRVSISNWYKLIYNVTKAIDTWVIKRSLFHHIFNTNFTLARLKSDNSRWRKVPPALHGRFLKVQMQLRLDALLVIINDFIRNRTQIAVL